MAHLTHDPPGSIIESTDPAPIATAGRNTVEAVSSVTDGARAYIDAGSKNRSLEAELRKVRAELIEAQAAAREAPRLKALAGLVETHRDTIVAARLIASTGASSPICCLISS